MLVRKLVYIWLFSLLVFGPEVLFAQLGDPHLEQVKTRLDSIESFQANMELLLEMDYINMPPKKATIRYDKKKGTAYSSEDFIMIPKKGLDFTMSGLFEYDVLAVERGYIEYDGIQVKQVSLLPNDKKANFTIATLGIDTALQRMVKSDISTEKEGSFTLVFHYGDSEAILPQRVEVLFEVEKIKIPLNFMGKEVEVDKDKLNEPGVKKGGMQILLSNYVVRKTVK